MLLGEQVKLVQHGVYLFQPKKRLAFVRIRSQTSIVRADRVLDLAAKAAHPLQVVNASQKVGDFHELILVLLLFVF